MWQLDNNYVKIFGYDIYLVLDYLEKNNLIGELLKNNKELYRYIIYTQSMDTLVEDSYCKEQVGQKLKIHLKK